MAREIEIGSVVELKSGGPRMTVQKIGKHVICQWFTNGKLENGAFEPEQLRFAPEADPRPTGGSAFSG
jgi:uncharacterized protein YodC (DUF2158 family)